MKKLLIQFIRDQTKCLILLNVILCFFVINSCKYSERTFQKKNSFGESNLSDLDTQFQHYFHILDSIAANDFVDQTLRATEAISFMGLQTGIEGEGNGTYFGTLNFTQEDLNNWHQWYEDHKDSIKAIRD